jgi:sugar (pentulose or hexulose) kinase
MTEPKQYIAVDLGAESGRVMLGSVWRDRMILKECYRFPNVPVEQNGSLRWDWKELFAQVKTGLAKTVKVSTGEIAGIGVDSWNVDFGLLNDKDELIEAPYCYRDRRTEGMMEKTFQVVSKRDIYEKTGQQFMQHNTLYQLFSLRLSDSESLKTAKKLIFIADLISYYLGGEKFADYTMASTSQLLNIHTGSWWDELFTKLDLPRMIMPRLVTPGTPVGRLKKEIARELGCGQIPVITVGSHDTASAVAAVPGDGDNWAYLSSGTWSLLGTEESKPIVDDESFAFGFGNEGGVENTIRFLKNVMGLWLVQQCRRQWQKQGFNLSYDDLTTMAQEAKPFKAYIDPDYRDFFLPGQMPTKVNKFLEMTGQEIISDKGQMIRVILENLALKYRLLINRLEKVTKRTIDVIHIIGGGIANQLLCQFAADAANRKVIAGPGEATAAGNILLQAIATGQIENLAKGREIIRNSFTLKTYLPREYQRWDKEYGKFQECLSTQAV